MRGNTIMWVALGLGTFLLYGRGFAIETILALGLLSYGMGAIRK